MLVPGSENEKKFVANLLKKHEKRIQEQNPEKKLTQDIVCMMNKEWLLHDQYLFFIFYLDAQVYLKLNYYNIH